MTTRQLLKKLLLVLFLAIAAIAAIAILATTRSERMYKKVKLDIDYFLYNNIDNTGVVVLKDGRYVSCEGLQYLIENNSLIPGERPSSTEQKFYLNSDDIDFYVYSEYHMQRIGEISHYTDLILDHNSYYSLIISAWDRRDNKDYICRKIHDALFYMNYEGLPILGRKYEFNCNYISFRYKKKLNNGQYVYKYNGLDNVYLLYDQRSPVSTELKQYPTLVFCDSLPGLHCVDFNKSGKLYVLQPTHSIKYNLGYLLWKDDVYLATYGELPELPASFSAKIDSSINESNMLLSDKWIKSYYLP